MSAFMGDFLGFQIGDYHAHKLNIIRVSTNDRYIDNLTPTFQDSTAVVQGGHGTYYWGTNFTQRTFSIDFAYDNLHDEDISKLRSIFSKKEVQPLIFDEYPYKKYMVKCQTPPVLKYICFNELETQVYKGEGSLQLVCYYPFAVSTIDQKIVYDSKGSFVNNNGDIDGELSIIYKIDKLNNGVTITQKKDDEVIGMLKLKNVVALSGDVYIKIDSRTGLIEGLNYNKEKTGHLYNKYIEAGDIFHLPVGQSHIYSTVPFDSGTYTPLYF